MYVSECVSAELTNSPQWSSRKAAHPCSIYPEWMHAGLEVCARVSVCWGLISTLDVLILSVLQRHAEACSDHTFDLQNNYLHLWLLLDSISYK